MKRLLTLTLLAPLLALPQLAHAHCEVPCGIYGDQRRFEEMLEDTQTIAKAISFDEYNEPYNRRFGHLF